MNHDSATNAISIPLTWREFVRAIADLPVGAEPNLNGMRGRARQLMDGPMQVHAEATAEMLKTLGVADPFASGQQGQWFERLCGARADQQPLPVPQGAVVIWRCDLVRAVAELLQLRAYRDHHQAKAARPSAAPEQGEPIARDYVLMPKRLTAENGAKGALSGEFKEVINVTCHECDGSGEDDEYDAACAECNGTGAIEQNVAVTWDTIKDIYKRAIVLLAAPSEPQQAGDNWQPIETAPHDKILMLAYEFDRPGDWRIKVGGYWDGQWNVFGASWTPTRWKHLPAAPAVSDYNDRVTHQASARSEGDAS